MIEHAEWAAGQDTQSDEYERLKHDNELITTIGRHTGDGMIILRGDVIVDANERAHEIFAPASGKVTGLHPWEIGDHPELTTEQMAVRGREFVARAYDGEVVSFDSARVDADDSIIVYEVVLSRFMLRDGPRLLGWIRDVTEARAATEELQRRVAYQSRCTALSNELISADPDALGWIVRESLARLCDDYGVERGTVWALDRERDLAYGTITSEAVDPADPIVVREMSVAPWIFNYALRSNARPAILPDEVPDDDTVTQEYLKAMGVQSVLLFPLVRGGRVGGLVSFGMTSCKRDWAEPERTELQLIAQVIGLFWLRFVEFTQNAQRERDLARSQRIAEVGSFLIIPTDSEPLSWRNSKIVQSVEADRIRGPVSTEEAVTAMLDPVHPEDHARMRRVLTDIEKLEERSPVIYRILRKSGESLTVEARFVVDRDEQGGIEQVFGTIKNVTEQVAMTEKLQIALNEISRLKEELEAENVVLRKEVKSAKGKARIIGRSPGLRAALLGAEQVAATHATVLILGETGTGKELIAELIHELSDQRRGPLVSVNCAALSGELIESELFGHEKGAFTNAIARRKGRFELADGGSLFLDEIAELPIASQAKLLRVLQSGEFERIGGTRTLKVNVRIIAATNRNLEAMVEDGSFRSDLFYRINQFPIELPPLRARREDIPLLANHFMRKYAQSFGKKITAISDAMIDDMVQQDWPGNVRELDGYIQRGMIATHGTVLDYRPAAAKERDARENTASGRDDLALESMQRRHIRAALEKCRWVIHGDRGAAAVLGIPASSLRSKMKRLGIERPDP